MDRLETAPPPPRDYDVIEVSALSGYVGRYVRLLTKTQKKIEGRVIGIDNVSVGMRIKQASGSAELQVPRSIVVEVQVPHRQRGNGDG
jgi:hypothetical protein